MITVYSKPNCPFCVKAKKLLDDGMFEYEIIDLTQHPDKVEMLKEKGCRSVPQVFEGEVHIGGYEDLKSYFEGGNV